MESGESFEIVTANEEIQYPPERTRPNPREVWTHSDQMYPPKERSVNEEANQLFRSRDYISPDPEEYNLNLEELGPDEKVRILAERLTQACTQIKAMKIEEDKLKNLCETQLEEAAGAVRKLKDRHNQALRGARKEYEETLKQYEDAKIVVLSYKSKNIELEGNLKATKEKCYVAEERLMALQRDQPSIPPTSQPQEAGKGMVREIERLNRNLRNTQNELADCKAVIQIKDEDIRELQEKKAAYRTSNDKLVKEKSDLERQLEGGKSGQKEITNLRLRLQDSQIACNKLSEEKKNLEATVKRFEDEGLVYRKQFDDVRQQLDSVNEGSMIAQKDIAEALRKAQDEHEQEVYKLQGELNQLKAAMSTKEKEMQSYKDEVTRLEEERHQSVVEQENIATMQKALQELKKELDDKEGECLKLQEEISRLQDDSRCYRDQIETVRQQNEQRNNTIREKQSEIDNLKQMTHEVTSLRDRLDDKEAELRQLQSDKRQLEDEISRRSVLSPSASEKPLGSKEGKLMKMLDEKHDKIKKLEDKLQVEKQVVAEKDKEIEQMSIQLEKGRSEVSRREDELQMLTDERNSQKVEIEHLRDEVQGLTVQLEGSRSDVTALEQELNTNVLQVKRLVGESEDKERRIVALKNELEKHAKSLEQVATRLQKEREARKASDGDREMLSRQLASIQEALDKKGLLLKKVEKELKQVEKELHDSKDTRQLLEMQVKEYTDEFSREKESHRITVQDKIHLQKAVQAKEREIQELQQKVDDHLLTTSGHLHHMWNEESQMGPKKAPGSGRPHTYYQSNSPPAARRYTDAHQPMPRQPYKPPEARQPPPKARQPPPEARQPPPEARQPPPEARQPPPEARQPPQEAYRQPETRTAPKTNESPRHPCPICGRTFVDLSKLQVHAGSCTGST